MTSAKQSMMYETTQPSQETHRRNERRWITNCRKFDIFLKFPITQQCFLSNSRGPVVEKPAKKTDGGLLSGWANKVAKEWLETISGMSI